MSYTPPEGDAVNFILEEYTVPEGDAVNFQLEEAEEDLNLARRMILMQM